MPKTRRLSVPEMLRPRIIDAIKNDPSHQFIQGVFGATASDPCFYYTIGNRARHLPDLLTIVPGWNDIFAQVLNYLGIKQAEKGKPFDNGEYVDYGAKFPAMIIQANPISRSVYMIQAGQYYGTEDYEVLQVLFTDPKGIYPDDPECQPQYRVPVLRGHIL